MAKKNEKTPLKKGKAQFNLIGKAKVNDYTFDLEHTYDSGWTANQMKISIDCGNDNSVFAEMSGGYFPAKYNRQNKIYVHGKKADDKGKMIDDYENRFDIDWNDRNNKTIIDTIGQGCFLTVGVEKDDKGATFYKNFLTEYDAVKYLSEHLEDGMVVNVKGNLAYETDGEKTFIKKKITSIVLSKVEPEKFRATFTQTILLDDKSIGKVDKDKNTMSIFAYAVDYIGSPKIDGEKVEVKQNFAIPVSMEFAIGDSIEQSSKILAKYFKVKKGDVTELNVVGDLVEGGSVVNITIDDLPEDIKELVECGLYSLEEMLTKAVGGTSREKRMVITKPEVVNVGEGDNKQLAAIVDKNKYKEDDLQFFGAWLSARKERDEAFSDLSSFESLSEDEEESADELLALLNG